MRLTLRTLLAYLDDVLDPADKEELAQKIESSDFAKDLVHQTRDSVRRLRLSAPQVIGTGMGMDPNTVAEYLDNALPPEQVGDYERICLEADVHLAETAACHHVLTMVLGEPAEVEPRSRQRMYQIPAEARERRRLRAEPAHSRSATTVSSIPTLPPVVESPVVARPQPPMPNAFEVPEYLRTRAWWQSRAVLAALAGVVLVGTALYFVSDMMGWLGGAQDMAAVDIDEQAPPMLADSGQKADVGTSETTPAPAEPTLTTPAPLTPATPPATGDLEPTTTPGAAALPLAQPPQLVPPTIGPSQPAVSSDTTAAADATTPGVVSAAQNAPTDQAAAPDAEASPTLLPATENAPTTGTPPDEPTPPVATEAPPVGGASADVPPQTAATPEAPALAVPLTTPSDSDTPPVDAAARIAAAAPAASPVARSDIGSDAVEGAAVPQGPLELGTYMSGKTVLLRYDESKGGWFRVEPRSAMVAGERLLSLPEFRPQITLESDVMLELSGGTQLVMTAEEGESGAAEAAVSATVPTIEVLSGRIVLTNPSNDEYRVRLKAGTKSGEARLGRNATLGFEVERPFVPGNDPRTTSAPTVATLYVPSGNVTWTDASGEFVVEKPSWWSLAEGTPAVVAADSSLFDWIDREPEVRKSETRYGGRVIEGTLVSDRPVDIQLLELFKGRDEREVKSLVTRSSIHVGLFAPFVDSLRDPSQNWPTWRMHIETVRSAMAQSPESAELVFKALVDERGRSAAAELYEMLCGYNAEQIGTTSEEMKAGAVAQLIDWLEEDSLDYRVLAVQDLWDITGKQLMDPAASTTVRKKNIRNWRNRLESGELERVKREE